ncbi:MAG TPA: class I SAM-dependent methyltransferase [Candidatus Dormibacteraeota bacterium]|nr:class I SAM-dependent methyltransferase [Candidatus Dormibacteraeota bacterium]
MTTSDPHSWTDDQVVRERYARSPSRCRTIYEFRPPGHDLLGFLLDQIRWLPSGRVLDAGCGLGSYFAALAARVPSGMVVGLDITLSMLTRVAGWHPTVPLICGDVRTLPVVSGAFDVVVSAHMLYHIPNLDAAIRELHRVLRPGGCLLAIYDSVASQTELDELFLTSGGTATLNSITTLFSIENGRRHLEPVFETVDLYTTTSEMLVTDPQPILDEIDCLRPVAEAHLASRISWEAMLAQVSARVHEVIASEGRFRITETKGVFVCRRTEHAGQPAGAGPGQAQPAL